MAGIQPRLVSPLEAEEVGDIHRLPDPIIYSRLPDAIIHRIFFFLPFKDAVKTSVLSKQWRFAWTSTPYIHLSIHPKDVHPKDVVPLISRSLSHCTAARLEKFHIDSTIFYLFPMELDCFFSFAVARRVEDASLVFADPYPHRRALVFAISKARVPKVLYDCESLVSLRVSGFRLSQRTIINWPSLKKLRIQHVRLDNDKIKNILSGCPVLESLRLLHCPHFDWDLRIDSATMRELVIYAGSIRLFHIWAPNLLSLNVWDRYGPNEEISLTGADLSFDVPSAVPGSFRERLKLLPVRILSNLVGWKLVHHENHRGNSLCGQIPPALMWRDHTY